MITKNSKQEETGRPSIERPWEKYYNENGKNYSFPKMNVFDFVYEENKDRADLIALEYEENKISFKEFFDKVNERTALYQSMNIQPGEIVTMATLLTPDFVYDFYALARLNAISNLIDPRTSVEGIKEYLDEAESKLIITNNLFIDKIRSAIGDGDYKVISTSLFNGAKKLEFPLNLASIAFGVKADICMKSDKRVSKYSKLGKETKALDIKSTTGDLTIVHTGGTTGTPKGVVLSHDNYNAVAMQYIKSDIGFTPKEKFMIIMPPWISYGSGLLHMTLVCGMTAQLIPKLDGKKMDLALIKNKPTWFAGVPAHFINMLDRQIADSDDAFNSVRSGAIGGGPTPAELFQDVEEYFLKNGCRQGMIPGYGLTECSSTLAARQSAEFHPGSVGIPLPGSTVGIFKIDEKTGLTTDTEIGYDEQGEVCLQTPAMMTGYFKNPELTKKVLVEHSDGNIWIHTGDLGYIDKDGFLFIDGRIKELIIRYDGFKVYPYLIENLIQKINGIETVKVVGITDPVNLGGEVPMVYYTIKSTFMEDADLISKEVKDICYKELAGYYTEGMRFKRIDRMPLTPIGKIDYRKLKKESQSA